MNNKNVLIECKECKKRYQVSEIEYKTVFWHGDILIESYCPYCGHTNQKKIGFSSSKGGKF